MNKSSQKSKDGELEDHKREKQDRKRITTQTTDMRDQSKRFGNVEWDCAVRRADRIRDVRRSQIRLVLDHYTFSAIINLTHSNASCFANFPSKWMKR